MSISPVSIWPALVAIVLALTFAWLFSKWFQNPPANGRFSTLDGLRGYLAFFVFLHHSVMWYFYTHTGQWGGPISSLYTHFGESSVALFFMITGFLFFSKIYNGRTQPLDWRKLYLSRILRLGPLYLFAMVMLMVIIGCLSNFDLHEPIGLLARKLVGWLSFTIFGSSDLNGVAHTKWIIASVPWTLRYEWMFYISLPLLSAIIGARVAWPYVAFSLLAVVGFYLRIDPTAGHLASFGGGIAASFLARSNRFRTLAASPAASVAVLICLGSVFGLFPTGFRVASLLLLTLAFSLIACGCSVFGVLTWHASTMLGEMCYSIYLLHALVLYSVFHFVFGPQQAATFTALKHWLVVCSCVPFLVALCFVTFRFVELPGMNLGPRLCEKFRKVTDGSKDKILQNVAGT